MYFNLKYILGDKESKLILTSPHGGYRKEESIPHRLPGCKGTIGEANVTRKGCIFKVIKLLKLEPILSNSLIKN